MKKLVITFLLGSFLFSIANGQVAGQENCRVTAVQWVSSTIECSDEPYKLVFYDEFDGNTLDESKWYSYYPFGENKSDQCEYCRTHGEEGQIYEDDNVVLENGVLNLITEEDNTTWYNANRDYTSGMIYSKNHFLYGKFEIRCKVPAGTGFWPAFWLWNLDECDVFEICGHDTESLNTNLHMQCENNPQQIPQSHSTPDLSAGFHTYSVEWEPLYVIWKLDGETIRIFHRYRTVAGQTVTCGEYVPTSILFSEKIIPNEYMHVIANLALSVGDSYCKKDEVDETTPFPSTFEIDYIRVYQKEPQQGLIDLCAQGEINGPDEMRVYKKVCHSKTLT
ncbi:MAG: glycoside hydrolase family 16 protein [Bacteroidota bacterium]